MNSSIDLMLAIRDKTFIFYHKDTNQFDYYPFSEIQMKQLSPDASLSYHDSNNYRLPSYEEINQKEIMRFYVRECVEDKAIRTLLFSILRRNEYMDAYLDKLHELNLYDDFTDACEDIYLQLFEKWSCKNDLDF